MAATQQRIKQDSNWIVVQCAKMRADLSAKRLKGVTGLVRRLDIKIEIAAMDYNELVAATKK